MNQKHAGSTPSCWWKAKSFSAGSVAEVSAIRLTVYMGVATDADLNY